MQFQAALNIYLNKLQQSFQTISSYPYFYQIVVLCTFLTCFLIGRITHEKKLTHLIDLVNDADSTRKSLSQKLTKSNMNYKWLLSKKTTLVFLSLALIVLNIAAYYFSPQVNTPLLYFTLLAITFLVILFQFSKNFLQVQKTRLQRQLKVISLTADSQIKEIIEIFGEQLTNRIKTNFQSDLEVQWAKDAKQQCKLYKCYNQKKSYEDLFTLYNDILNEIKKVNLCDICLNQNNINVQKLNLGEIDILLKNCRRNYSSKMDLEQKKQIVNRLLKEYQEMSEKLAYICRRGCCVRQRVQIESAKAKYHDRLRSVMSQLSQH